jgi:hypothetical protein
MHFNHTDSVPGDIDTLHGHGLAHDHNDVA